MSGTEDDRPMFPAVRLWARTRPDGTIWLSGVWGGARIVVTPNRTKTDPDDADWLLLLGRNTTPAPRRITERNNKNVDDSDSNSNP